MIIIALFQVVQLSIIVAVPIHNTLNGKLSKYIAVADK